MIQKPYQAEGRVFLTKAQERKERQRLYREQKELCAECERWMTEVQGHPNTVTLDHIEPQPAGCKKDGRRSNLRAVCFQCNYEKGSKRTGEAT